jgi:pimeloyl-ACP methyl ester carboxylesterase
MPYQTASIASADGTTIRYRVSGSGPSVVLLHGAMQAAQNFTKLARALADSSTDSFTVFVPNRRGRGGSGPFGPAYGLDAECADLEALLRETGARCVFGLSSGALIALHAGRRLSGIDKLALYEPPLKTKASDPTTWVSRYLRELDGGDLAAAMVTVVRGTGDASPLTHVPRWVLVPLVRLALRLSARAKGDVSLRDLIPTLRFDAELARESEGALAGVGTIRADVLLLGGERSARALRVALDELARRLPKARRVEFAGIGHLAADDTGRPLDVAEALRRFFRDAP